MFPNLSNIPFLTLMKVPAKQPEAMGISGPPEQMIANQVLKQIPILEPHTEQHLTCPSNQITKYQAAARNDSKAINSWK